MLKTRGFMFDLARLTEQHDYYRSAIEFVAARGANVVVLHLTDHQGCAMQFARHPSLATPYAFDRGQLRDLQRFCEGLGVAVIPEIECFGHAGFALRRPEYRALGEELPKEEHPRFFSPTKPETRRFLQELLDEVAETFDHPVVHVGCDEVALDQCPLYDGMDAAGKAELFAGHVRALHAMLAARGKRLMMWGDMVRHYPAAADLLPADIMVCDWDYGLDPSAGGLRLFLGKGFETWAAPALVYGGEMVAASARGHRNVVAFARRALQEGASGVLTTLWVPQRTVAAALYPSLAFAATVMNDPLNVKPREFWRRYAEERYGLRPDDTWLDALETLWLIMPSARDFEIFWWCDPQGWERIRDKPYEVWDGLRLGLLGAQVYAAFIRRQDEVASHREEYDALVLAARIARHCGARLETAQRRALANLAAGRADDPPAPGDLEALRSCLDEDLALEQLVSRYWDLDRYADDPKKETGGGWTTSQVLLSLLRQGRAEAERVWRLATGVA